MVCSCAMYSQVKFAYSMLCSSSNLCRWRGFWDTVTTRHRGHRAPVSSSSRHAPHLNQVRESENSGEESDDGNERRHRSDSSGADDSDSDDGDQDTSGGEEGQGQGLFRRAGGTGGSTCGTGGGTGGSTGIGTTVTRVVRTFHGHLNYRCV